MPRATRLDAASPYPPGWEPFLAAINADLDDDTPRLVFADWLQENGDEPRAEFIRIQHEVERGDFTRVREADRLLKANKARWCRGLPKWVMDNPTHYRYRRGFLTSLKATGEQFAQAATNLRRYATLASLTLSEPTPKAVAHPALAGVQRLTIERANATVALAFAKSPALSAIRELSLSTHWNDPIAENTIRPLFECGRFCALTRLSTQYIPAGDAIAVALSESVPVTPLEELDLSSTNLSLIGITALARSAVVERLRVLRLMCNPICDEALSRLTSSRHLSHLVELRLNSCRLTLESLRLLRDWKGLSSIRVLSLWGNDRELWNQRQSLANSPYATGPIQLE